MPDTYWNQDSRTIVWTCETPFLYNLYVNGVLVGENLPLEDFFKLYNKLLSSKKAA